MNILILGCGYIGMDLANYWKKKGHFVTATTHNPQKMSMLDQVAHKSILLEGSDEKEIDLLINDNDLIVVLISANILMDYENAYLKTATSIHRAALRASSAKKIIYASSTSIYGEHHGKWVDETGDLNEKSEQSQILIETEKLYLSLQELGWDVTVFRLADVYGPQREISKKIKDFLEHTLPGSGENHTNMVHKDDVVAAIEYALTHHLKGIYNLADDEHPTRKQLYEKTQEKFDLPAISWDPSHTRIYPGNKRVSNHKIKSEGFVFKYPHRILD